MMYKSVKGLCPSEHILVRIHKVFTASSSDAIKQLEC